MTHGYKFFKMGFIERLLLKVVPAAYHVIIPANVIQRWGKCARQGVKAELGDVFQLLGISPMDGQLRQF
jgi:hypothetical protein